jgi:hypothetical protein
MVTTTPFIQGVLQWGGNDGWEEALVYNMVIVYVIIGPILFGALRMAICGVATVVATWIIMVIMIFLHRWPTLSSTRVMMIRKMIAVCPIPWTKTIKIYRRRVYGGLYSFRVVAAVVYRLFPNARRRSLHPHHRRRRLQNNGHRG